MNTQPKDAIIEELCTQVTALTETVAGLSSAFNQFAATNNTNFDRQSAFNAKLVDTLSEQEETIALLRDCVSEGSMSIELEDDDIHTPPITFETDGEEVVSAVVHLPRPPASVAETRAFLLKMADEMYDADLISYDKHQIVTNAATVDKNVDLLEPQFPPGFLSDIDQWFSSGESREYDVTGDGDPIDFYVLMSSLCAALMGKASAAELGFEFSLGDSDLIDFYGQRA